MPPAKTNSDQLHGRMDMLVVKTLQAGPLHGYAIALRLEQMSNDILSVEEGSLYPALYRLESAGEVSAVWEQEQKGRRGARRRIYRLTPKGNRKLERGRGEWQTFVSTLGQILAMPAAYLLVAWASRPCVCRASGMRRKSTGGTPMPQTSSLMRKTASPHKELDNSLIEH